MMETKTRFLVGFNINRSNLLQFPILFVIDSENEIKAFEKAFKTFIALLKRDILFCTPMSSCYLLSYDYSNGFSYTVGVFPELEDDIVRIVGSNWRGIYTNGKGLQESTPDQMLIMRRILNEARKDPRMVEWEESEEKRRSRPYYDVSTGT